MYLVYIPGEEPFITFVFIAENNFAEGMFVFDFNRRAYTVDGENWKPVELDHL